MANAPQQHEVVVQIPDLGLNEKQIQSLKETFQNEIVSSLGGKSAVTERIVVVVIRVQRAT
jgi:hypothetical protein